MAATNNHVVLGAIDVGTNSVKLELARPLPNGSFETLHDERDPVRPGEGVFKTGWIDKDVAERLLSTLRRYGALCRRFHARVRAVATSAVREAKNRDEIIRRARAEAGLNLEVVSGREEARLICLGVLHGRPAHSRALCVDIGGGSTEVASAIGPRPINLWSISLGAVRLTELFDSSGKVSARQLARMREYTAEVVGHRLPKRPGRFPKHALGSSGTIKAVIAFAAPEGTAPSRPDVWASRENPCGSGGRRRRKTGTDAGGRIGRSWPGRRHFPCNQQFPPRRNLVRDAE